MTDTPDRVGIPVGSGEIARLLNWARQITAAGRHADPTERAAYQAAKADLLARITHGHHTEGGTG